MEDDDALCGQGEVYRVHDVCGSVSGLVHIYYR